MWNCGGELSGKTFAEASFTGHQNEKNFVGLATDGDYIACGSEDNSLYVYYKGIQIKYHIWFNIKDIKYNFNPK